ncbi:MULTISPECIES: chloride channel protein [Devosia]|uniref:Chloride channel protein, CIC family n=1 Tax=Devosia limi DSM 17137 TaxID=1121477 RepID=A0A1M5EMJ6_9HYPH|nr:MULTISPECIES: chloride channel protein [Devosia]MBU1334324.1 chloride channel protein [Alphaproteobacteria bacterium]MBU1559668.1 chloride channel protein [Alphaproteobacteria bacterium]MBU2305047.1 chloride channel protein [Alphaproteobacteria bacterium]MBU2367852.1 chloride channel protein [Alphaproteobacteria bacterium]SHF80427.1 chloride channel protein, CIC family [Devosia limi DSM 17137]
MFGFFRLPKLAGRFGHLRSTLLFVLGSVVGALGGLVVTGVSNLTQVLHHALFGLGAGARLSEQAALGHPLLATVPAVGGILMGATIVLNRKYRKRQPVDPIEANALHGGRMSMRESAVITSQTVISSSFGASVGLEAGYTQLASAAGSWLATRFRLRRNEVRMLVGCGAAGAIAAAFGAPLTGAFYAFELIVGIYSIGLLAPVVGAALAGNLLAVQLGAVQTHIELGAIAAVGPYDIVAFVALGLIGGSFAVMLMRFVGLVERALVASRLPIWLRPAIGGLAVGGLGLITPQVLSSGHGALHLQFSQSFGLFALVGLLVLKSMASAISLGAGFRGGLFFASLFLGALIGKISAMGASLIGMQVDVGLAAVVGMAAVATGVVGGPLTLTFLILETTNDLAISGAVMVASAISGVLVREMFGFSFSTWRLHLRGESIRAPYDIGRIRSLTVGAIMRRDITTIEKETSLSEFRQRFPLGSTERVVAMDSSGAYEGIVLVAEAYQPWEGEEPLETIEPLLRHKDRFLLAGINASDAAAMFEREGSEELAVVENITSRKVIGLLTEAYLLRRYSAALDQGWKDLTS